MKVDEFLNQEEYYAVTNGDEDEIKNAMIEFAKFHVEAALKVAAEKAKIYNTGVGDIIDFEPYFNIEKESILNAYPLKNII